MGQNDGSRGQKGNGGADELHFRRALGDFDAGGGLTKVFESIKMKTNKAIATGMIVLETL